MSTDATTVEEGLSSDVEVGRKSLRAFVDSPEDAEILGFVFSATTGDVTVPREWLTDQWREYGLSDSYFPSEVWPSSAYKRAMKRLITPENGEKWITPNGLNEALRTEFEMKKGDGNIRHILAHTYYPEAIIGEKGGRVSKTNMGYFNYDSESQSLYFETLTDEGSVLEDDWFALVGRAQQLFRQMQESHNGPDLRGVLLDLVNESSTAVPLRDGGAVYFFPAGYEHTVESLSEIWSQLNQFKDGGRRAEIDTVPVIDNETQRQQVERKAKRLVEEETHKFLDAGLERMEEEEERTAEEIAGDVVEELEKVGSVANEYSALLETKLSVKRQLKQWREEMKDSEFKDEIADAVLEEYER